MKKIIRLTESDVSRIVRKVLSEQGSGIADYFVNQGKKLVSKYQQQGGGMKKISNAISGGLGTARDTMLWKKFPCIINNPYFKNHNKPPFIHKQTGTLVYNQRSKKNPDRAYLYFNNGRVVDNKNSKGTFRCEGAKIYITWTSGPWKKYQDSKKQQTTKPPVKTTGQKPIPTTKPTTPVKPTTQPAKPTTPVKPTTQPAKPTTQPAKPTTQPAKPTTQPAKPITQFTPSAAVAPQTFDDSPIPLAEKYYLRRYSR